WRRGGGFIGCRSGLGIGCRLRVRFRFSVLGGGGLGGGFLLVGAWLALLSRWPLVGGVRFFGRSFSLRFLDHERVLAARALNFPADHRVVLDQDPGIAAWANLFESHRGGHDLLQLRITRRHSYLSPPSP